MKRAVVFGYHDVGARGLRMLLAHGIEVPLAVTHEDDPREGAWFESVADTAALHGIETCKPQDPNEESFVRRVARLEPDFLFSFYYRHMLGAPLLRTARLGAYNLHGSLLPRYRGRAPINWAILNGERRTGATLHRMVEQPDAGPIVDQQAVPILPDDCALDVLRKVTCAAEIVLDRSLPRLVAGTMCLVPVDLSAGSYFGRRRPEDGCIDWRAPAQRIHDLVRAVAPPYPGAFCRLPGGELRVLRTMLAPQRRPMCSRPGAYVRDGACWADCGDGHVLRLLELEWNGAPLTPDGWSARFGRGKTFFDPHDLGRAP